MMILVAILLLIAYAGFLTFVVKKINQGAFHYLLIFLIVFLPFYTVFLSFTYDHTESIILVRLIQYSKEILLIYALMLWLFGKKQDLLTKKWIISDLDKLFILFLSLSFLYIWLPLGEASLVGRITYFKNIFLMGLVYFFGRQTRIRRLEWRQVFKVVFIITCIAFVVVVSERLGGKHFHTIIGYAKYNLDVHNIEPAGNYGLKWTFEAQGGQPRYASIFSNPLEFAASMLFSFTLAIILLISVKFNTNRIKYLGILTCAIICVLLAYSRATMVAFFGVLVFMALLLRYYKILVATGTAVLLMIIYVSFLASDDTRYFVEDTLLFQNSSSITHVIEWVEGIESITQNPMGIGLAMSGNAGGVEEDLRVGGENQFLIYGVQIGVIGMVLYMLMIFLSIRHSWLAFRRTENREDQLVPFVAACIKFGLLLPLLTANAEAYLYIALVSWWLVGASQSLYWKQVLLRRSRTKRMTIGTT